ncbi:hypothetical protein IAT40_002935 [Kwoniella sp. CBS 6097]
MSVSDPLNPLYEEETPNVEVKADLILTQEGPTVGLSVRHRESGSAEWKPFRIPQVDFLSGRFDSKSQRGKAALETEVDSDCENAMLETELFNSNIKRLTKAFENSTDQLAVFREQIESKRKTTQQRVKFLASKAPSNITVADKQGRWFGKTLAEEEVKMKELDRSAYDPLHGLIARDMVATTVANTYESAYKELVEHDKERWEGPLTRTKETLQDLATRLCPEDEQMVGEMIDSQIALLNQAHAAVYASIDKQCGIVTSSSLVFEKGVRPAIAKAGYDNSASMALVNALGLGAMSAHLGRGFKAKYGQYRDTERFPTDPEQWKDIWTSPLYQVGRVELRSALVHLKEGLEGRDKAAISQSAMYTTDGENWQPVDEESVHAGTQFETPEISGWHLSRPGAKLSDTFLLKPWKDKLESASAHLREATGRSSATGIGSEGTESVRREGESRSEFVCRLRKEKAATLLLTQGLTDGEKLWTEAVQKRQEAFNRYFEEDRKRANPRTDVEKNLFDQWRQILQKTMERDATSFLAETHSILADHTDGDEQSRHLGAVRRLTAESEQAERIRIETKQSLGARLQETYESSQIPTGGNSWGWRFNPSNPSEIPSDVTDAEAPRHLREAQAMEHLNATFDGEMEYTRADDKSGGVPPVVQKVCPSLLFSTYVMLLSEQASELALAVAVN